MTYNEKVILQKRLEKAEYLTRAQISKQADILDNAQLELWDSQSED